MIPKDSKDRKTYPLMKGLFDYFPAALAAVAHVSYVGNEQHNPGQKMFDNREKSNDDYDCMLRHLTEVDLDDDDGLSHAAKVAWRALRALQKILEERGAPVAPAAHWPTIYKAVDDALEEPSELTCPNNIEERVPGCATKKKIAHAYYYEKKPGARVEFAEDCSFHGDRGIIIDSSPLPEFDWKVCVDGYPQDMPFHFKSGELRVVK